MAWEPLPQDGRRPLERLSDRALLLLTINSGEEAGKIDYFRLMKIPFVVQYTMNEKGIRSFSYRFYRVEHGPISKAIYDDRDTLREAGLIEGDQRSLRSTLLGDKLSRIVREALADEADNRTILEGITETAHRYASMPSWEAIKAEVYDLKSPVAGKLTKIGRIPSNVDVLAKLPDAKAKSRVRFPEEVAATLSMALCLTPERILAASTDSGLAIDEVFA